MRGILSHSSRLLRINGITPAHAGNTICEAEITLVVRDHPRTRGEYRMSAHSPKSNWGSPPHTRGIRVIKELRPTWVGITPAHAGNTIGSYLSQYLAKDHPRTRGEYIDMYKVALEDVGSPPHTRGILVAQRYRWRRDGITPAHAGNTASIASATCSVGDHPRTRGEYLAQSVVVVIYPGSPPHTRGIRKVNAQEIPNGGITPAHAGNTGFFSRWKIKSWDHPRTRGEYSRFR